MSEEALLDATEDVVDDSVDQTGDLDADSGATDDSAQDTNNDEQEPLDTAPVITDANGQLKLSETARAQLDKIKAENPRLAREIRAALFDRQALLAKVPGGIKEALSTIEAYESEGGSEAVQQVKAENKLWQDLDADFTAGDPKFVEDIAKGNPEAFTKIAPTVMAKFAEMAPDHFSHHVAKVFASDMASDDIPLTLKLFRREIEDPARPGNTKPGLEGVAEIYNSLQKYSDKINGLAKKAPAQAEGKPNAAPTSEIDQREQALTIREFTSERAAVKESITAAEFAKNAGTRKLPAEKVSTIGELYETALDRMVKSIPGHTAKVDRFLAAKDKAGYRKHMEAAIKLKAPEAMAQAFRKAGVGAKPGPAAKPAAKPANGVAKPTVVTTGFNRVGIKPDHNSVNWTATNSIPGKKAGDGRFVLRDGSKVLYTR